ncbi:MAG: tRNA (guanine(26)-N(2))-dimethyltransferase [Candidatus Caldarchaeum sp.]
MVEKLNEFGFPIKWYSEGRVKFLAPAFPTTPIGEPAAPRKWPVFYNPFSSLSRDLTVVLARTFNRGVVVAEPLGGSGVRSIRLLVETDTVSKALINDINPNAVKTAKHNAEINGVIDRCDFYEGDAAVLLSELAAKEKRVDYVDVDPVGSPVKFLENSLRAVKNDGFIGVSATDVSTLVGNKPSACLRKYGLLVGKNFFAKETGVRVLAGNVILRAAANNIAAKPVLSVYHRHFIRIFFHVTRRRSKTIKLVEQLGWILACTCLYHSQHPALTLPNPTCPKCGKQMSVSGPAWTGPLHEPEIVDKMLKNSDDLTHAAKILSTIAEEIDTVGFYPVDRIAQVAKTHPPSPLKLVQKLRQSGYLASQTHIDPTAVKTNAPIEKIFELAFG